jgi:hypothetical protein
VGLLPNGKVLTGQWPDSRYALSLTHQKNVKQQKSWCVMPNVELSRRPASGRSA